MFSNRQGRLPKICVTLSWVKVYGVSYAISSLFSGIRNTPSISGAYL